MKRQHEIDMSVGNMLPKLLTFALPLMLSGVLQLAFNAADLIVVGRFVGEKYLAAVGSNGALVNLVINILMGLGTGASVLTARHFGARDFARMRETVGTTLILSVGGGVLFGAIGVIAATPLLRLMGTPEDVLPLAALYLRIYFLGMPVIVTYNFASAILRAVGDTKRPLYFLTLAGALNVGMNLFFVLVCHMDVAGVAIATVLSQCVSAALTVNCILHSDESYHVSLREIRFSKEQFREILRIGLPAGIQGSLFSISNVIIQSSVNSFGSIVMAGNSAASSLESFAFCAQDGISQTALASVSQNMGARQYERTKTAVKLCTLLEIGFSVVLSGLLILFRVPLLGIYTTEAAAVAAGCRRLVINGAIYFTNGLMNMMAASIRGHGYSLLPTAVTLIGVCAFRILWIFTVFRAYHSLTLLYLSYPISWVMTSSAQYICYFRIRHKAFERNEQRYLQQSQQSARS